MKKLEILLRKVLLQILLWLNPTKQNKSIPKIDSNSNVLLIRLNRIGDALVSTPFIKFLKESTNCKITVLADKKNHFVYTNNPFIDNILIFNKGLKGLFATKSLINKNQYNIIIDMHDDASTTVSYLISMCRAEVKIGLKKGNDKVYTNLVDRVDSSKNHVVDRLLKIGDYLGLNTNSDNISLVYKPEQKSLEYSKAFLTKNFPELKYLFGINISAGSDARFWGIERFQQLIEYVKNNFDVNILIITSSRDINLAKEISQNEIHIFCENDFDRFAAIVNELNFLFTPDTSIIHLASAFKIPLFGLYVKYMTSDIIWHPYNSKYDCIITTDSDFNNLSYKSVVKKFLPFLQDIIGKNN